MCLYFVLFFRPFFTYWITFVHLLVMIVVSSVYGFAPYGWDYKTETALVSIRTTYTELEIIVSHWPFSRIWPTKTDMLGQIYCTFPMGNPMICSNLKCMAGQFVLLISSTAYR